MYEYMYSSLRRSPASIGTSLAAAMCGTADYIWSIRAKSVKRHVSFLWVDGETLERAATTEDTQTLSWRIQVSRTAKLIL